MSLRKRGGGGEGGLDNESFDNDDVPRVEMNIDYSKNGGGDGSSQHTLADDDMPMVGIKLICTLR